MRVAFDLTLADRAMTGTRVYARELLAALRDRSMEVLAWKKELGARGTGVGRLVNAARLTAWLTVDLPRRIAGSGIDAYHAPCSIGPLRSACPRIMTVHDATDLTMGRLYDPWWRLYLRVFGVRAVRRADAVIVPSRAAREEVAGAYGIPPERIWVTPEGVRPRFRPVPAPVAVSVLARYGIRPPYVLFIGVQSRRKNLGRLVEAYGLARGRARSGDSRLVLAGAPGSCTPVVRRLVERLSLRDDVVHPGWIDDADLPALYSGATCLVYPSLAEGFGLPILEAMACGTPVLTSGCSSMPEVAGDAAVFVDPLSVESIADGLVRLLTDEDLRADLVARGLARARLLTWERTAEATEAVYRAVAARRIGPSAS